MRAEFGSLAGTRAEAEACGYARGSLELRAECARQVAEAVIPHRLFLALPCLRSIAAMMVMSRCTTCPKALLTPCCHGDRT